MDNVEGSLHFVLFYAMKTNKTISTGHSLLIGFADSESSNLYENLSVQTKMVILSRRLILLSILLYAQLKYHTEINLCPNTQF